VRRNIVRKTTESKYVDVLAWPPEDGDAEPARASKMIEEKYATETPEDTCYIEDS
jgi:hypothetical protein